MVANVEDVVTFMLVGTDQFRLKQHVVGEQGVGNDAPASSEVLARVPSLGRWCGRLELLTVDAAIEDISVERIQGEDVEAGDEIADLVIGRSERGKAAGAADASPPGCLTGCRWFPPC